MAVLKNTTFNGTSALVLPKGTTAQRPTTPVDGDVRFNTDLGITEYYYKGFWADTRTNQGAFRKDGAVVILDATLRESYPGSGTTWTDISGNGNNFTVNASAYQTASDNSTKPGYMDFGGSYGLAVTASGSDVPGLPGTNGGCTYFCVTRVLQNSANWRTLTRAESSGSDHHIIIQSGGWGIGMYDNTNGTGFNNTGFSQQSLPCYRNPPDGVRSWEVLAWTWSNEDNPTYRFFVNGVVYGTITSANARYKHGFRTLGGYSAGSPSQFWGQIKYFAAFNRRMGLDEVMFNSHSLRYRFGI